MSDKDTFIQQLRQERDNLKSKSDELFLAHEDFMLSLCEILKVPYEEVDEDEILDTVKKLMTMMKDLVDSGR